MATSTAVTEQSATSTVDIKPYNETYRVYAKVGDDGKIAVDSIKMSTAGKDNAAWTKLEQAGYTQVLEQTVKLYDAGTIAGAQQLVEDSEECVNIWNRGAAQKLGQKLKSLFTELKPDGTNIVFDPIAGAFDSIDLLNEETRRRNLSPIDKARNGIKLAVKAMFPGLEGNELESKVDQFLANISS